MGTKLTSFNSGTLAATGCTLPVEPTISTSTLWTCQQGAAYLAMSVASFWHRCRTGEIPHIRLSARCYRVRQADLDDYLRTKMR